MLLVGESDGSQIAKPIAPKGVQITPGDVCPDALHDAWVVGDYDRHDHQVRGYGFRTWHPLWDLCFIGTYAHEHGSAASALMGYKPRYDYVALKNYKQDESHRGFKDFVLDADEYRAYIGIHARMSNAKHFGTRHHTLVMAAVEKKTGDLAFETRFKADFGALAVRAKNRCVIGVNERDEQLLETTRFRRLVNVIDPKRLDPALRYRRDGRVLEGQYEQRTTTPSCSTGSRRSGSLVFDFKNPALALRSTRLPKQGQVPETTALGKVRPGENFVPHTSQKRELILHDLALAGAHCFPGTGTVNGLFYTDPKATQVFENPGPSRTLQFVRLGFNLVLDGKYRTADPWLGLYTKEARGDFQDIAMGINEQLK